MAYAETAENSLPSMTAAPGVLALQRALVWLVGASGAIVLIEPSPYELVTLTASVIFFATGLRMRLAFVPVLLLLFLLNVGYTISAVAVIDRPNVGNWIATSWYMAITVMFFAMVLVRGYRGAARYAQARPDRRRADRVGSGAGRLFQPGPRRTWSADAL